MFLIYLYRKAVRLSTCWVLAIIKEICPSSAHPFIRSAPRSSAAPTHLCPSGRPLAHTSAPTDALARPSTRPLTSHSARLLVCSSAHPLFGWYDGALVSSYALPRTPICSHALPAIRISAPRLVCPHTRPLVCSSAPRFPRTLLNINRRHNSCLGQ